MLYRVVGIIRMARQMQELTMTYRSSAPVAAAAARAAGILTEKEYYARDLEGRLSNAITMTMGAASVILPYGVLSRQELVQARIYAHCEHDVKSICGINLAKALLPYFERAKREGYVAVEFIAEDGIILREPMTCSFLSSHAMENKTGPVYTPHQVLAFDGDVQYLQGLREIRFSRDEDPGFFFVGEQGMFSVVGIDSLFEGTSYESFYKSDSSFTVPLPHLLGELGILPKKLRFFAKDRYSSVVLQDRFKYVDVVRDGDGVRIASSVLGKKHHIKNIDRVGISEEVFR